MYFCSGPLTVCVWCDSIVCVCVVWQYCVHVCGVTVLCACVWCDSIVCVCVVWRYCAYSMCYHWNCCKVSVLQISKSGLSWGSCCWRVCCWCWVLLCVIVLFLCHCCFVGGGGGGGGSEDQSKGANLGLVTESERVVHDVASLGLAEESTGVKKITLFFLKRRTSLSSSKWVMLQNFHDHNHFLKGFCFCTFLNPVVFFHPPLSRFKKKKT